MMNTERKWVLDASVSRHADDGLLAFCPVELDNAGEIASVVTGLTVLGHEPPNGEPCIAVIHDNGQAAVLDWCEEHSNAIAHLFPSARTGADK